MGMHVAVYVVTIITQLLIAGYGKVRIVFGMADAVDWSESSVHLITIRSCAPLYSSEALYRKYILNLRGIAAPRAIDSNHLFSIKIER
jgi:hypothetical protein